MSNDAKKPGSRDISDLKARLGLKKGGETGRNPAQGGVPPPGTGKLTGAYVPPPPGVAPPPGSQPQGPVIPDATQDPFAAMNAIAAHGARTAAPEFVIVNDGKPVEQVHKGFPIKKLLVFLGVVLILVVGFVLGGINYERKEVGATIGAAGVLKKEVSDVGKKLQNLQNSLFAAKDRAGGKGFQLFDTQLNDELDAAKNDLGIPTDDPTKLLIYNANLYTMDRKLIADTLMFYADLRTLQEKIQTHVTITKEDAQKNRKDPLSQLPDLSRAGAPLGAIIRMPAAKDAPPKPYIEIVQLGAPICADNLPHPEGCQPVQGYQFRTSTGDPWSSKEVVKDQAAVDQIIPIGVTGVLDVLVKGSEKTIEEGGYYTRLRDIDTRVEDLIVRRKDIENRMNTLAQRGKPLAI